MRLPDFAIMKSYTIYRVSHPPPLTADWTAPGWSVADIAVVDNFHPRSSDHRPRTEARVLADDQALYLQFRVQDRYVRSVRTAFYDDVCKDSCVEWFVRPGTNGPYFNFEFNAGGTLLVSCMKDWRRLPGGFGECIRFTPEAGTAIERVTSLPAVVDPEIPDPLTWTLAARIPLVLLRNHVDSVSTAPGTFWQGNFYKCASDCSHPHWASWSPLGEELNFHLPAFFGSLSFAEAPLAEDGRSEAHDTMMQSITQSDADGRPEADVGADRGADAGPAFVPERMDDFAALIDAQLDNYRNGFDPGERVEGRVIEIGATHAVLDVNAKREGLVALEELRDSETGALSVGPGDRLEVWFAGMREGAFLFSCRLSETAAVERSLADAFASRMPVEGLVAEEVKGGYRVDIGGKRAFCPYSQMSLHRVEGAEYLGQRLRFLVSEFDAEDRNVVLSRRALLELEREAQRDALRAELQVGDQREGIVTRLAEFGVFVDLGGIDGLVPLSELAWQRGLKPGDVVAPGDRVRVALREIDWDRNRISLSLREAQPDPWLEVAERFPVGTRFRGTVTRLEPFGAFVALMPGVDGLVPISWLGGGRRLQHPREVLAEGQALEWRVESLDVEARRISLRPVDLRLEKGDAVRLEPGVELDGIVENARDFGVFVRLREDRTGLLHISETDLPRGGNPQGKLEQAFPPDSTLRVVIKSIEGQRISLTLPGRESPDSPEQEAEAYLRRQAAAPNAFGSLGNAFDGLDL